MPHEGLLRGTSFLPEWQAQELANVAWAVVKLSRGTEALEQLAVHAKQKLSSFSGQQVCNLAWALAVTNLRHLELWDSLAAKELSSSEVTTICWCLAVVRRKDESLRWARQARPDDVRSLLKITWTLHHLRCSDPAARDLLLQQGRKLDEELGLGGPVAAEHTTLELVDRLVMNKPAGWAVESGHLSLKSILSDACCPIFSDEEHHFGFIHRLDVPSSGLILLAKSYEAYYDLQHQLNSGALGREYIALCHGFMRSRLVRQPLSTRPGASSSATRHGKPSATEFELLAHGLYETEAVSLVRVRIFSGRTHQIRAPESDSRDVFQESLLLYPFLSFCLF